MNVKPSVVAMLAAIRNDKESFMLVGFVFYFSVWLLFNVWCQK